MSKTQLYIGTDLLDFTGIINVKRQVKDYRDPAIGASNKSFTLQIPLTPSNQILLKNINDIRSREEVTDTARLVTNGVELIQGRFRILSLTSLYVKAIIEADDWIEDISGISIRDLSWVSGDQHTFTSSNIVASWTAGAGAFYRYPLINFATLYSEDIGTGAKIYPYDFYPTWNIEDIVTKIFIHAGYTLASGGFFASTQGQKLYLLSTPLPNSDDFLEEKALTVYVDDDSDNYNEDLAVADDNLFTLSINQVLDIDAKDTDEGNDFAIAFNRYTAPQTGTYRFQSQIKVVSSGNDAGSAADITENSIDYSIRKNEGVIQTHSESESAPPEPTIFNGSPTFALDTGWIHLDQGDIIDVHINIIVEGFNRSGGPADYTVYVDAGISNSFLTSTWDGRNLWPGIGYTCDPATMLPDIDSINLLKGLKQIFNLRFWMDRPNKKIYIETSDEFYGDTVIDWTDKIDFSEKVNQQILAVNYTKHQKFKYMPDSGDKTYNNYVSANGVPFQKEYEFDGEYVKLGSTTDENVAFSPTILANMSQIGHFSGLIPKLAGSDEFVTVAKAYPAYRAKQWNARLLSWEGLTSLITGDFNYYDDLEDSTPTNYTTFPSAETLSMVDMFDDYYLNDFRRINENKIVSCVLILASHEIIQFNTVVGTAPDEGFRAKYKLNVEGIDMYFILDKIVMDGDRVKAEFIQKM